MSTAAAKFESLPLESLSFVSRYRDWHWPRFQLPTVDENHSERLNIQVSTSARAARDYIQKNKINKSPLPPGRAAGTSPSSTSDIEGIVQVIPWRPRLAPPPGSDNRRPVPKAHRNCAENERFTFEIDSESSLLKSTWNAQDTNSSVFQFCTV